MKLKTTRKLTFLLFTFVLFSCNNIPKMKTNTIEMSFVYIAPGTFNMGSDRGNDNEKPIHEVTISQGFYLQTTEVTVKQFKQFIDETGYQTTAEKEDGTYVFTGNGHEKKEDANWKNPYFEQTDDHPVVCVSRYDIDEFIQWLSKKEQKQYRLPTEAEWEYACRAGSETSYFWGDSINSDYCWYKANANGMTHPVKMKKPNANGLYDILGNVMEVCNDIFDENYYSKSPKLDPQGPDKGDEVVYRGGSWFFDAEYCECFTRLSAERNVRSPLSGFRLVLKEN